MVRLLQADDKRSRPPAAITRELGPISIRGQRAALRAAWMEKSFEE